MPHAHVAGIERPRTRNEQSATPLNPRTGPDDLDDCRITTD
jgi:hypothetical protein